MNLKHVVHVIDYLDVEIEIGCGYLPNVRKRACETELCHTAV